MSLECSYCHNAAAGHDKIVPPEHECAEHQEESFCYDCDPDGYMAQFGNIEEWHGDTQ